MTALDGILSVIYSIPLRRIFVTHLDLPYPEDAAAAETLRVGDPTGGEERSRRDLLVIIKGAVTPSGFAVPNSARAVGIEVNTVFIVGVSGTMASASSSFVLLGVGHLVGIAVGIAMIVGLPISYGVLLPTRSWGLVGDPASASGLVSTIFRFGVCPIGVRAIAVAVVWTLLELPAPIIDRIRDPLVFSSKRVSGEALPLSEQGLSGKVIIGMTIGSILPIGVSLWLFLRDTPPAHHWIRLVLMSIPFTLITDLAVASVYGYMTGLIGASNSPISGVDTLVAIVAILVVKIACSTVTGGELSVFVVHTLFTVALVLGTTTILDGDLQGLKTGRFVGAAPRKQQLALIIGAGFGAIVIPPVLNLMYKTFDFQGAPGAGQNALAVPQASLISDPIKGVFGGDLNWGLLGTGTLIGMIVVIIDEVFKRTTKKLSLPGLAVGTGTYLPMTITIVISIGVLLSLLHDQWAERRTNPEKTKRMGTLVMTDLIVGESLWGVVYAGIIGFSGEDTPFALFGESFATPAQWIDTILFVAAAIYLYKDMRSKTEAH